MCITAHINTTQTTKIMKKLMLLSVIISTACNFTLCNPIKKGSTNQSISSYYGTWVVKKYKWGGNGAAFDDKQASAYIGEKIVINNDSLFIFDDKCSSPSYSIKEENTFDYLYKYLNEEDTSLIPTDKKEITVIEAGCKTTPIYNNPDSLNFSSDFIMINDQEMMVPINGAYFYLEKVKSNKTKELSFKELNGTGDFKKRIDLNSCNTTIKIDYNFYSVPDKLILEDSRGNVFYSTEMESTDQTKTIKTDASKLKKTGECYFYLRVESSEKNESKWSLKVTLSEY